MSDHQSAYVKYSKQFISSKMPWPAKALLRQLLDYEEFFGVGSVFKGIEVIAKETGQTPRTAQRWLRWLRQQQYITTEDRSQKHRTGHAETNRYWVTAKGYAELGVKGPDVKASSHGRQSVVRPGVKVSSVADDRVERKQDRSQQERLQQERESERRPSGSASSSSARPSGSSSSSASLTLGRRCGVSRGSKATPAAATASSGTSNGSIPPVPPAPPSSAAELDELAAVFGWGLATRRDLEKLRDRWEHEPIDRLVAAVRLCQADQEAIRRSLGPRHRPDDPLDAGFFEHFPKFLRVALKRLDDEERRAREAVEAAAEYERQRPEREASERREAAARAEHAKVEAEILAELRDAQAELQQVLPEHVRQKAQYGRTLVSLLRKYTADSLTAYCRAGLTTLLQRYPRLFDREVAPDVLTIMAKKVDLGQIPRPEVVLIARVARAV